MLDSLSAGDDVAILPAPDSPPHHTLEIVKVAFVNLHLVRLVDHRIYSRGDRRGLTSTSHGFVAPATDAHRSSPDVPRANAGGSFDDVDGTQLRA
jgi:hypothetical protein